MNVTPLSGRKSYGDLERERDALRDRLAQIRAALNERRYGDALKLSAPEKIAAPIPQSGGAA